jgi:hypothetical protein
MPALFTRRSIRPKCTINAIDQVFDLRADGEVSHKCLPPIFGWINGFLPLIDAFGGGSDCHTCTAGEQKPGSRIADAGFAAATGDKCHTSGKPIGADLHERLLDEFSNSPVAT